MWPSIQSMKRSGLLLRIDWLCFATYFGVVVAVVKSWNTLHEKVFVQRIRGNEVGFLMYSFFLKHFRELNSIVSMWLYNEDFDINVILRLKLVKEDILYREKLMIKFHPEKKIYLLQ